MSGEAALGARIARGGVVTVYGRAALDGDVTVPFFPSPAGNGREEWLVEYTFGREGPREIAFRRVDAIDHGDRSSTRCCDSTCAIRRTSRSRNR